MYLPTSPMVTSCLGLWTACSTRCHRDQSTSAAFESPSVRTMYSSRPCSFSIYDIPTMLNEQGLDEYIVRTLGLSKAAEVDWSRWQRVLQAVHNPKHEVTIGLVGKYIDLPDAYL